MPEVIIIATFIIFGLLLLVLEIIFVPGLTLVGAIGFLSSIIGVYLGYSYFGVRVGSFILSATLISMILLLYYAFKSGTWKKFVLKKQMVSKVNENEDTIQVGQRGITTSELRPVGTVNFEGELREASAENVFLPPKTAVKVIRVRGKKIWVKSLVNT